MITSHLSLLVSSLLSKSSMRSIAGGILVSLALVFASAPLFASGHELGESFEQEVGEHLIDIGYTPENFSAGSSALFEFELWRNNPDAEYDELDPVAYDDVWVRIVSDGTTMFASGVHNAEFGGSRMTYVFPEAGEYELSVRYERGLDTVAEATFPFTVAPKEGSGAFRIPAMAALVGVLIGTAGVYFIRR